MKMNGYIVEWHTKSGFHHDGPFTTLNAAKDFILDHLDRRAHDITVYKVCARYDAKIVSKKQKRRRR